MDNRPGAGMTIGIDLVAKATPDGHTMKALKAKDMLDMLARAGTDPLGNTPREATEFLKAEIARWGKVVRQAGVKIE